MIGGIYKVISQTGMCNSLINGVFQPLSTVKVQEVGTQNTFLCRLLGNSAYLKFYENDILYLILSFSVSDSNQQHVTVEEVFKLHQ